MSRMTKEEKEELGLSEYIITELAQKKADELNVKFKVTHRKVDYGFVVLVRIKNDSENVGKFADYIGELLVGKLNREVHFTYPTRL